jgi:hypothetical protein
MVTATASRPVPNTQKWDRGTKTGRGARERGRGENKSKSTEARAYKVGLVQFSVLGEGGAQIPESPFSTHALLPNREQRPTFFDDTCIWAANLAHPPTYTHAACGCVH